MKILTKIALLLVIELFYLQVSAQNKQPNVVLILIDDLGYGDLACYGHREIKTPNIDKLASQGMKFTQFYSPSPLCSPSRAGLLTGRTPFRTGIQSWIPENENVYLHKEELTIASILNQHGYQSFMAGKWHLNGGFTETAHSQPQQHGFDNWYALHAFPIPNTKNTTNFFENGKPVGPINGFAGEFVVDKAISYLKQRDKNKPFFLYLPMVEVHGAIASPDKYLNQYSKFTDGKIDLVNVTARGPGEYYAHVTFMDNEVGRVLKTLKEMNLEENTIVIFTSDNGPVTNQWRKPYEINLYGNAGKIRGRKGDLYEGGIRVPAIIRYPNHIKAGAISNEVLHGYDFLPTICSLLNIPKPTDRPIDGEDFSAVLKSQPMKREKPLFWGFETLYFQDPSGYLYAVRDGDWKVISDENAQKLLLFNLKTDPYELNDVSQKNPEVLTKLKMYVLAMKKSIEEDPLRPKKQNK